jgi:hypothetical protein
MIDLNWSVVDLDPVTWRNLGPFLPPREYIAAARPGEHGLFILHDGGTLLNVVDTASTQRPEGIPNRVDDPVGLAQALHERGAWDRVHVIDRRHLARVAAQAQATNRRDYTLDAYYHLVYTLIWGDASGYACVPPRLNHWHGWTYEGISRFVKDLPSPGSLALGVYAGESLVIGLILVCEAGLIRRVTTFEGLSWESPTTGPTEQMLTSLHNVLDAQFAPPAAILLCTEDAFSGWLEADEKMAYLAEARANGSAIWHFANMP